MNISKFILNNILGWKVRNTFPDVPKCIIVVAPHTSNWDFIIGKLAYSSIGRTANFLIKKEWFVFPFNLFFKSIGGIPVERSRNNSMTGALAAEFEKQERLQLANPRRNPKTGQRMEERVLFHCTESQRTYSFDRTRLRQKGGVDYRPLLSDWRLRGRYCQDQVILQGYQAKHRSLFLKSKKRIAGLAGWHHLII